MRELILPHCPPSYLLLKFLIFAAGSTKIQSQEYFEGVIYYKHSKLNSEGKDDLFPIEEEIMYHTKTRILNRVTKGMSLRMIGDKGIYLDNEKLSLSEVDFNTKEINRLESSQLDRIEPYEFKKIDEVILSGYLCDVYSIKYKHTLTYMKNFGSAFEPDTLNCTYFIAQELKIANADKFARLQGNHNTKLLDGRFAAIPLKVIMEMTDGSKIIIEATKVEARSVAEFFDWSKYKFIN